ncbi:suppressor of fused domain protein [Micromonospora violae]|uniref:suppressor of fused domain protein n=1 Tax=Micromonospora violae TaxID=1278207 RepID=UPI0033C8DA71
MSWREDDARIDRAVEGHLSVIWPWRKVQSKQWTRGRNTVEIPDFRVLEVHPSAQDGGWVYASVGAWRTEADAGRSQEFILLSPEQSDANVELLAMVASAHNDARYRIRENAIIDIGRPWLSGSLCDHILVVEPYFLDEGQDQVQVDGLEISYLWLVPVTPAEAEFGRQMGGHVLFHEFADAGVDLVELDRPSLR